MTMIKQIIPGKIYQISIISVAIYIILFLVKHQRLFVPLYFRKYIELKANGLFIQQHEKKGENNYINNHTITDIKELCSNISGFIS